MASELYYMPLYQKDWLSSSTVQQMSVTAEGIYFRLCLYQWEDESLPATAGRLQRLVRATDAEWAAFDEFLDECFPISEDGKRRNPRVASEREQIATKFDTLRENGRKGGRPKKTETEPNENQKANQQETKQKPNGNQMVSETETKTEPKQNQTETISELESESESDSKYTPSFAREHENEPDDHSGLIFQIGGSDPQKAVEAYRAFSGHLAEKGRQPMGIVAVQTLVGRVKTFAEASGVDPGALLAEAFYDSTVRGWKSVLANHFPEYAKRLKSAASGSKPGGETMEEEYNRLIGGLLS